jgi:cytochrome c551/c552
MRYLTYLPFFALAAFAADPPEQAQRGKELFALKGSTGYACTTCHALDGQGKAVGPDLKTLGQLHPRAIVTGILATRTQYVQAIGTPKGKPIPVIKAGEAYFDLSRNPPEPITLTPEQIKSARDNADWKHPPESRGLTKPQLADLIAYIRFATSGDTKGVDPKDLP